MVRDRQRDRHPGRWDGTRCPPVAPHRQWIVGHRCKANSAVRKCHLSGWWCRNNWASIGERVNFDLNVTPYRKTNPTWLTGGSMMKDPWDLSGLQIKSWKCNKNPNKNETWRKDIQDLKRGKIRYVHRSKDLIIVDVPCSQIDFQSQHNPGENPEVNLEPPGRREFWRSWRAPAWGLCGVLHQD